MTRIVWSDGALRDIEEIRTYIARTSRGNADLVLGRILHAAERLAEYPMSGRAVPEFGIPVIREVIQGSYRILYVVETGIVSIARVFHSSRQLKPEHLRGIP